MPAIPNSGMVCSGITLFRAANEPSKLPGTGRWVQAKRHDQRGFKAPLGLTQRLVVAGGQPSLRTFRNRQSWACGRPDKNR